MGSDTGRQSGDLDTSQPGIRQIHAWIRNRSSIRVELQNGTPVCGVPRWVDQQFLALETPAAEDLVLVNREAIGLLRMDC
ncbi:MAG: hypothetical protein RLZZ611_1963 [Cyanobacteriota bacterium]|jgi:hypothetical protein